MPFNTESFRDQIGIMKIVAIIVGIIDLGFIGHSYYKDGRDEAYLSCVIICFIISFLWALAIIVDVLQQSEVMRKIDMLYNMIASLFYLVTLICFFVSLIDHSTGKSRTTYRLWERVIAFILGIANTGIYGLIGFMFYRSA